MNFSITRFSSQILKHPNTRQFLSISKNQLLRPSKNTQAICITRAVLTRPKEMDELKKKAKERIYQEYEYKTSDQPEDESIDLYGYFLLSIPIITFGLGTWQVGRLNWKLSLIKDLEERLSREPVELPENFDDLKELEYCPIKVRGEFLYDKEFTVGPRSLILDGRAATEGKGNLISGSAASKGFNIITPFKLENSDKVILVNRGWVPHKFKNPEERKKTQLEGEVEITGINRLNETRPQFVFKNEPDKEMWHYRDVYQMADYANTDPIFLDMIESYPGENMPIASQTRVNLRNEHLSYIITWYGLTSLTGFYWYRMFILKKPIF